MNLEIRVHDVGHGHSVQAFTPNGQVVVVDLGCSADFSPLAWLRSLRGGGHLRMNPQWTCTIDMLVISHPHGDHIDEMLKLRGAGFHVRQLYRPKWLTPSEVEAANQSSYQGHVRQYLAMSTEYNDGIPEAERVGVPSASGGVSIDVFWSATCGRSNINNHSAVVVFGYEGSRVVVPGDNEPPSWRELLEQPRFVTCVSGADVFVASHHGRESGYYGELMSTINPRLCIVSDGRVQDTDATSRYSAQARGWTVHHRSGARSEERKCLTTRTDGYIDIGIGRNSERPFLSVTCN